MEFMYTGSSQMCYLLIDNLAQQKQHMLGIRQSWIKKLAVDHFPLYNFGQVKVPN